METIPNKERVILSKFALVIMVKLCILP